MNNEESITCPKCGRTLAVGSKFCQYCGESIGENTTDINNAGVATVQPVNNETIKHTGDKNKGVAWRWVAAVLALAVLVSVGGNVYLFSSVNELKKQNSELNESSEALAELNDELTTQYLELINDNTEYLKEINDLRDQSVELMDHSVELMDQNTELIKDNTAHVMYGGLY